MKITLADLGERLQTLRKALDLSQKDLAATLEVGQNQISRLENGIGGSLELLLQLFNFYGEHFHIQYLLAESFEVCKKGETMQPKNTYASIALEKLKMLHEEVSEQMNDIISIMEKA